MKILLFVNKDLHANLACHLLRETLANHEVVIFYSDAVGGGRSKPWDLERLEYFEKEFFYQQIAPQLKASSILSKFGFLGQEIKAQPIEKWGSVNGDDFLDYVRNLEPDLMISIRFAKIFRQAIIQIPKKGILNLHSAILPDYRGILGALHALKDGQKEIGCTLHYIQDKTIDTGGIINIARLKTNPEKSLFWHVNALYPLAAALLIQAIESLEQQEVLTTQTQDRGEGKYFSLPTAEDFTKLKKQGFPIIKKEEYLEFLKHWISSDLVLDNRNF